MTGPRMHAPHAPRPERPKGFKAFFPYAFGLAKGFLSRLFYIVSLVWETAPMLFISMVLLCILDGVLPVVGSYITKDLLNGIQALLGSTSSGDIYTDIFVTLRPVLFLFLFFFIYQFITKVLARLNAMVNGKLIIESKIGIGTKAVIMIPKEVTE